MRLIDRLFRKRRLAKLAQDIDASLADRKALRLSGKVPVSGYVRGR